MSDRIEESDEKTDISKLEHIDRPSNADRLKIKICDGLVSMQPDYGTVRVDLGIVTAHSEVDSFHEASAVVGGLSDGIIQRDALTYGAEGILVGEHRADLVCADLGLVQSGVAGATYKVRETAFNFGMPTELNLASDSMLGLITAESALRIQEGAFITQPAPGMFSIDDNASMNALSIEQGVFALGPVVDPLSLCDVSPDIQTAKSTLMVENGLLVANPTERLLAGESSLLGIDLSQGTLFIKEEPLNLSASYLSSQLVLDTQEALSSIEWAHVGDGLGADILDRARIQDNFLDLSNSYSRLLIGDEGAQASLATLPSSVIAFPPVEYYHNVNLIGQITTHEYRWQEDTVETQGILARAELLPSQEGLLAELERMGGGLATMLRGAVYSLSSHNPDRVRHFSTSMRELFTQVLHRLAPDDAIRKWSVNESDYYSGRPTRSARIRYICREFNQDSFEPFVESDIKSISELLRLFQRGTHTPESTYTERQLSAMRVRMENAIRFWIEISKV